MKKLKEYVKLIRAKHYLKNILIFLPLVFSTNLLNSDLVIKVFWGYLSFCCISSVVYIINDRKDIQEDRKHPIKKNRPLAAKTVSKKEASVIMIFLAFFSVLFNYLSSNTISSYLVLGVYFIINYMYSLGLKNVPIVDILLLASGFILRILYGAIVCSVVLSNWLYLTIMAIAFYLGLGKRRNETMKEGENTRKVLKYYGHDFLDKNMYMCLTIGIVFYSLWCIDPANIARFTSASYLIYTVPIVIVISMKYGLNVEGNSYGDPVDVILSDKVLMALIVFYAITMIGILYGIPLLGVI